MDRFNSFFKNGDLVDDENFDKFFSDVLDGEGYSPAEKLLLAGRIEEVFLNVNISSRSTLLFFISKLSIEKAYLLANAELEAAYGALRMSVGYLYRIIMCKNDVEFFLGSDEGNEGGYCGGLSAIEADRIMRIAFDLIKNMKKEN